MGAGGFAGAALLGVAGCGGGGQGGGGTEVVFSFFTDPTGSVQGLIDRFNRENGDGISVRLREMPADSGQHFDPKHRVPERREQHRRHRGDVV